jgi:hypothetical protein
MKRSPVSLLVSVLALGPGILLFAAGAGAIPASQDAPLVTTNRILRPHSTNQVLIAEQETGPEVLREGAHEVFPDNPACRQVPAGSEPVDGIPADNPCIEPSDEQQRLSVRLGKRIGTRSDILGELDGVRVDYRMNAGLNLNGIAGYPVLAAGDEFNSSRQVFGISATTNPFAESWDLSGYLFEQQENGQSIGRSLGGAIRYLQPKHSLLVYLDYDPEDHTLGMLIASGAWKLPFKTTLSATLDLRNHPLPGRERKYLQQTMSGMQGWDWLLPDERLAHYTAGDGSEVGTLAVGLSHVVSPRIRLNSDFSVLDATHEATTDTTTTGRSSEYFYHLKLTGKDLMIPGDQSKLDLRHNVTRTGRTSTATLDTHYAINRFWKLTPKLRTDYLSPASENPGRWVASPRVKLEYRGSKQSGFQIEAGGDWSTGASSAEQDSGASYYLSLGYQASF